MTNHWLSTIVNRVRGLADDGESASDGELLSQFRSNRNESAFDRLLVRHAGMVWSVCRSLLPNDADAEDAFQATFVALVNQSQSIRVNGTVGGWLHGTACRIVQKAKRTHARRLKREQKVGQRESTTEVVTDSQWTDWQTIVHDEIAKLPAATKEAFVACVLEGQRHQDAANTQNVAVGTIAARVSRARQTLLTRLTARGLAPAFAAATAAVTGSTTTATVPHTVMTTLRQGLMAGQLSTSIHSLASLAIEGATMKTKLLAATVMIGSALALSGSGMWLSHAGAQVPVDFAKPTVNAEVAVPNKSLSRFDHNPHMLSKCTACHQQTPSDLSSILFEESKRDWLIDTVSQLSNPVPVFTYLFIPKPATLEEFKVVVMSKANEGWEYMGSERFVSTVKKAATYDPGDDVIVFKKRADAKWGDRINDPNPVPLLADPTLRPSSSNVPTDRIRLDQPVPMRIDPPTVRKPIPTPTTNRVPNSWPAPMMSQPVGDAQPILPTPQTSEPTQPTTPTQPIKSKPNSAVTPKLMDYYVNKATINAVAKVRMTKTDPEQVISAVEIYLKENDPYSDVKIAYRGGNEFLVTGPKWKAERIRDMIVDLVNEIEKSQPKTKDDKLTPTPTIKP